jgi:hypothetical protein
MKFVKIAFCLILLYSSAVSANSQKKIDSQHIDLAASVTNKIDGVKFLEPITSEKNSEDNFEIKGAAQYNISVFFISLLISIFLAIFFYKFKKIKRKRTSFEMALWQFGWFGIFGFFVSFIGQFGKVHNLLWYPTAWSSKVFFGIIIPTLFLAAIGFAIGYLLRTKIFSQ